MTLPPRVVKVLPAMRRLACVLILVAAGAGTARAAYHWRNVEIGGGGYVTGLEYHPTERDWSPP